MRSSIPAISSRLGLSRICDISNESRRRDLSSFPIKEPQKVRPFKTILLLQSMQDTFRFPTRKRVIRNLCTLIAAASVISSSAQAQLVTQMFRSGTAANGRAQRSTRQYEEFSAAAQRSSSTTEQSTGDSAFFDVSLQNSLTPTLLNGDPLEITHTENQNNSRLDVTLIIDGFTPVADNELGGLELSTGALALAVKPTDEILKNYESAIPITVSHQATVVESLGFSVESTSPEFVNSFTDVLFGNRRFR